MEFQGLQTSFPIFVIVIVSLLICLISWYTYKRYTSISTKWKITLSTLRASALILLFFLFLNPFFKTETEVTLKPKIAVLLDISESTAIHKETYQGNDSFQNVIATIRNVPSDYEADFLGFGSSVLPIDPAVVVPSGTQTNIYNAIENVVSSDEEYVSVILVTDGIITAGKNPIILARESHIPIHVIALGDTSKVKDVSIKNITTNGTGFTNTVHKITAELSQYGFDEHEISINLKSDDQLLDSKKLKINSDTEIYTLDFELELSSPGLQQYQIEVITELDEWLEQNNTSTFSIEVLESKNKILHIASGVHPDVKALRSILSLDENIELSTFTTLNPNYSIKNFTETDEYDLVIYHGLPTSKTIAELGLDLNETASLFILLPNSLNSYAENTFSLINNRSPDLFDVQIKINSENSDHAILEGLPDVNLLNFAPLQSSINASNAFPEAQSLLTAQYQNITTDSPLISILEQGNIRRSEFLGSGWFKMFLSPNADERIFIEQLLINLIDWTASNPDNRLLKIKPSKNSFNSNESPLINASLINETGDVETQGVIEITITNDDFSANYTMENLDNGNYQLQIPSLADGRYEFLATARKGNREIDQQSGEFLVSESSVELANTTRNNDLLSNIALGSKGEFMEYTSVDELWNNEEIRYTLNSKKEIQETYIFPIRSLYWFFLVIALLAAEWIGRKRFALP